MPRRGPGGWVEVGHTHTVAEDFQPAEQPAASRCGSPARTQGSPTGGPGNRRPGGAHASGRTCLHAIVRFPASWEWRDGSHGLGNDGHHTTPPPHLHCESGRWRWRFLFALPPSSAAQPRGGGASAQPRAARQPSPPSAYPPPPPSTTRGGGVVGVEARVGVRPPSRLACVCVVLFPLGRRGKEWGGGGPAPAWASSSSGPAAVLVAARRPLTPSFLTSVECLRRSSSSPCS